jgi:hypothetical protein
MGSFSFESDITKQVFLQIKQRGFVYEEELCRYRFLPPHLLTSVVSMPNAQPGTEICLRCALLLRWLQLPLL